ncbi:sentrin-specific protease 1 [Ciona intestinalis]
MPSKVNPKRQNNENRSFTSSNSKEMKYSRMSKHNLLFNAILTPRKPRSIFDKTFSRNNMSATKNRVMKNSRRPRVTEIERCTNIAQREQYKLLIEQYRKNTLAETEKIFFKSSPKDGSSNQKQNIVIVDLSETDTSPVNEKPALTTLPNRDNSSFQRISPSYKHSTSVLSSILPRPNALTNEKQDLQNGTSSKPLPHTPTTRPPTSTLDWFSPSSPYLCKNFVSNLVGTYGRRERDRKRIVQEEETRVRLLQDKRRMKEEMLSEMLKARLHVDVSILTDEMEDFVSSALFPNPPHEVLVEQFNISITREHIMTLDGLNWLNDEIINFYMELIVSRSNTTDNLPSCHAMNTFFYPKLKSQGYKSVRRWTKRVDVFSKDIVIYPIHLGVHWTLAVVKFGDKRIEYLDSMGATNTECLEILKSYLVSEHQDKKKADYDVSDWKIINMAHTEIPQQMNGSDCGVFTCTFAEYIARNSPLAFKQSDMPNIRRMMVWEIVNGKLLH